MTESSRVGDLVSVEDLNTLFELGERAPFAGSWDGKVFMIGGRVS